MKPATIRCTLIAAASLLMTAGQLDAQIGDRIRRQVQDRVNRGVDEVVSRTLDRAECAIADRACIDEAEREGREVRVTDESGREIPGGAAAAKRPGEGAWANYDFVPGARVLFTEDFVRDRVGNFPSRLEYMYGNLQVVEWEGRRWVEATSTAGFAVPLPESLPDRFTIEMDVTIPNGGMVVYFAPRTGGGSRFLFNGDWPNPFVVLSGSEVGIRERPHSGGSTMDPKSLLGVRDAYGELVRLRIHADGNYVKVYLNENRVANIPNVNLSRSDKVYIELTGEPASSASRSPELIPTLIADISINADAEELYEAITTEGRWVTQGILFDTGSDRIRPESTPTLREIGDILRQNATLRIAIEGHTDSTGNAATNQSLSEQRAAAVRAYLIESLGIDAGRLESRGMGQTQPVAPNETPEGRQANRRVELVRL